MYNILGDGGGDILIGDDGDTLQEGTWRDVVLGADAPGVRARGVLQTQGPFMHGFLKFRLPGDTKVHMVHMSIDLRDVESAIEDELEKRAPGTTSAAAGGKIARRIKSGLRTAVKRVAKSKIVKGVINVAKRAFNNPLVKGLLSATPMGAAMYATASAARVAAKAIKGGKRAKQTLAKIAKGAKAGNPDSIKAARLVKAGMKMTGILPAATPQLQAAAAAGEPEYLAEVLGQCVDCQPQHANVPYVVGCGADEGDADSHEIDALETFATSGAFEGVRWVINRLGFHSLASPAAGFSKRDALLAGLNLYAPRH